MKSAEYVIIGGGPTGLGAAHRLYELNQSDWVLLEKSGSLGGLASSVVDEQGFIWDLGGHVLFSHYDYFDNLLSDLLKENWLEHQREAWIWMRNQWIPYPFQNNMWRLPEKDLEKCLTGLDRLKANEASTADMDFDEWIVASFGEGIADVFMRPYNFKVWAYPPHELAANWVGERVATINKGDVLRNIKAKADVKSWGPNAVFRFPAEGGTGTIWSELGSRLPKENIALNTEVQEIDSEKQVITCGDGQQFKYRKLITTMPLPVTIERLRGEIRADFPFDKLEQFKWSSTHVIGLGIEGSTPEQLRSKCWMYFPEDNVPFYRATVFSNYSPKNVPLPGRQWSLMCEISESARKKVNHATVISDTIQGLHSIGVLPKDAKLVSTWKKFLPFGYPTPFLGRDEILNDFIPRLEARNIFSRGRFGGWKYEVSNQDHSLMQGVELINALLLNEKEQTYWNPTEINKS